jgi:hypothetical protein
MNSKILFVTSLLMLAAMAGGLLHADTSTQAADRNFPTEATKLLKEIQSTATKLSHSADTLHSYRQGVSWQSHANELNLVKEHINTIGDRLEKLKAIRHAAEPWQKRVIDSILPVGLVTAARTDAAIRHLTDAPNYLWAPAYTEHLECIALGAHQMKQSIDLHLEMSSTQNKLEELRDKAAAIGS